MTMWIIIGVVVLLVLFVVAIYNGLIAKRNRVDNAWSQVDVQLRRRYDLIPNLVETVKGYAKHEQAIFERVSDARAGAIAAKDVPQQAQAENMLTGALRQLFAVAEAYPDLKANQNFLALQEELTATEGRIAFARQFFNDTVLTYNNAVQQIPSSIIASMFGFKAREFFEIEEGAAGPVQVDFS
jgi:LemA protein